MVKHDPFANATKQVNDACDILGIKDKELREYLAMPNKMMRVKIPVKMDMEKLEFSQVLEVNITMTEVHTKEVFVTLTLKVVSNTWNAKSWHFLHG